MHSPPRKMFFAAVNLFGMQKFCIYSFYALTFAGKYSIIILVYNAMYIDF